MVLRWYYHLSGIIENILHGGLHMDSIVFKQRNKTNRSIQLYTPMALFNRFQYMKFLGVAHILPPQYNRLLVIPPPSTLHTVSG